MPPYAAEQNFEIWWIYKSVDTRPKYIDAMNQYVGFFRVSIHAHFVACVIALYRFFEKRRDTVTFPNLLKSLSDPDRKNLPIGFVGKETKAIEIWKKICIIRNNCFSHLKNYDEIKEWFKKADMSTDEMREIIELSKEILNSISRARGGRSHAFNLSVKRDTIEMLEVLNRAAGKSDRFP